MFINTEDIFMKRDLDAEATRRMSGRTNDYTYNVFLRGSKNWITGRVDQLLLGRLIAFGDPDEGENTGFRFIRHDGEILEEHYETDPDNEESDFEEVMVGKVAKSINGLIESMLTGWEVRKTDNDGYLITLRKNDSRHKFWLIHGEESTRNYHLRREDCSDMVLLRLYNDDLLKLMENRMTSNLALGLYQIIAFSSVYVQRNQFNQLKAIFTEAIAPSPYDSMNLV